jgi:cyclic beta-1,2-glucan synthetase
LTITAGQPGLLSWGGTMFEFLMPVLFQAQYPNSLLTQACEAAVARQMEYGKQTGVPWGVSESAFAAHAINSDYHYQSFGVPGLGLKRGLSDDLVVAPYATMLALAIDPKSAVTNLRRLASEGGEGRFGFYDAVDYSPTRLPPGRKSLPVRCYMAHHQAMSIVAIANVLLDRIVERRFNTHPIVRATELLLQEAVPTAAPLLQPNEDEATQVREVTPDEVMVSRRMIGFETPAPRTHLLSNGTYSVMVTNTGGGYSRFKELAVNRWRPDALNDNGGQFIFIRNRRTGQVWSATYQPTCKKPDFYEVIYSIDKAE